MRSYIPPTSGSVEQNRLPGNFLFSFVFLYGEKCASHQRCVVCLQMSHAFANVDGSSWGCDLTLFSLCGVVVYRCFPSRQSDGSGLGIHPDQQQQTTTDKTAD